MMTITSIKMNTENIPDYSRVLANFSIVFDNCFVVHDIALVKGRERNHISFYSRKNKNNEYVNICHPISSEFRKYIESTIIEYYENEMNKNVNE